MNERINLPAQEWLGYDPERGDIHGYTPEQMREFAELIIKKTLLVARAGIEFGPSMEDAVYKYFGVER